MAVEESLVLGRPPIGLLVPLGYFCLWPSHPEILQASYMPASRCAKLLKVVSTVIRSLLRTSDYLRVPRTILTTRFKLLRADVFVTDKSLFRYLHGLQIAS